MSSGVSQIQKKIGLIALAEKRHQNGLIARRTLKGNAVGYYSEKPSVATPQKCPITLGAIPTTNGIYAPWPKQQRATACSHEKGQVATIPKVSGHPWRHTSDSRILRPHAKTTDSSSLLALDTEKDREALGFSLECADRYLPTGALNHRLRTRNPEPPIDRILPKETALAVMTPLPHPTPLANKSLERTIYMRHGSCSELQLPRRIPLVAQFWR